MARATRASHEHTVAHLERSSHILIRVREELRAYPASARTVRLLERNETARTKIAQTLESLREQQPAKRPARVK